MALAATPVHAWQQLAHDTDVLLRSLFDDAVDLHRPRGTMALLAIGGYGRRELAPFSDLDLLLVHSRRNIDASFVRALWYPLWNEGRKVGHAVRTPKQTYSMIRSDLDTATALVTARVVAGDATFGQRIIDKCNATLRKQGRKWLGELHARVLARHETAGEVAYLLEPNLKDGLGGLRDIHAMWWAHQVGLGMSDADLRVLSECNDTLLKIRTALHCITGRPGDVLHLQDQSAVASKAGFSNDDNLMETIATVARRVMWISDETWARLDPPANRTFRMVALAPGVELVNGEVHLADDVDPATDPTLVLRVATAAARTQRRIDRDSLDRLGRFSRNWPTPWPAGASDDLVALLLEGERAIPVWEALEQRDLIGRIVPEWSAVRCKPQRNAFHRFTVDRHLWQTAANAAALAASVTRPDLLVLAALFHDIGKGYPGDHTEVGIALFGNIGPRMGLNVDDVQTVTKLIEHHLLLPDVATRRDVSDDSTIAYVAKCVGDTTTLQLLYALTQADALATGPTAWGNWKAELVRTLVERTGQVLAGHSIDSTTWRLFPDAETLEVMARRLRHVQMQEDAVTVVCPDQPGLFSAVAGVLAIHGLDILGAEAHSDEQGMAASRFRLRTAPPYGWAGVIHDIHQAFDGELNIDARLHERATTYSRRKQESARGPQPPVVLFHDEASSNASVVEVHAPDRIGLLRDITRVFIEQELDIRHARVATLGDNVVDTFYLRERDGRKITGTERKRQIEHAILSVQSPEFGYGEPSE
ncbi:MAG: [protein-PII] uridylyltransferase [Ilumatobacteraceae bacterium]